MEYIFHVGTLEGEFPRSSQRKADILRFYAISLQHGNARLRRILERLGKGFYIREGKWLFPLRMNAPVTMLSPTI